MKNILRMEIKRINESAILPKYATEGSAGADLYACLESPLNIESGETCFIGTGISVAIPDGFVGLVYARSGLACKQGLAPANKVGVIDSDYRGEIKVALHNHSSQSVTIKSGERIAQMVITPYYQANFIEVDELCDTERGTSGFGSTGKK